MVLYLLVNCIKFILKNIISIVKKIVLRVLIMFLYFNVNLIFNERELKNSGIDRRERERRRKKFVIGRGKTFCNIT